MSERTQVIDPSDVFEYTVSLQDVVYLPGLVAFALCKDS